MEFFSKLCRRSLPTRLCCLSAWEPVVWARPSLTCSCHTQGHQDINRGHQPGSLVLGSSWRYREWQPGGDVQRGGRSCSGGSILPSQAPSADRAAPTGQGLGPWPTPQPSVSHALHEAAQDARGRARPGPMLSTSCRGEGLGVKSPPYQAQGLRVAQPRGVMCNQCSRTWAAPSMPPPNPSPMCTPPPSPLCTHCSTVFPCLTPRALGPHGVTAG